jgi:hypothetical protein
MPAKTKFHPHRAIDELSSSSAQFPAPLAGSMQWARAASCQCAGEQENCEGIREEERGLAMAIGEQETEL